MSILLGFLQKNMGDPYYEPTIVVHGNHLDQLLKAVANLKKYLISQFWLIHYYSCLISGLC